MRLGRPRQFSGALRLNCQQICQPEFGRNIQIPRGNKTHAHLAQLRMRWRCPLFPFAISVIVSLSSSKFMRNAARPSASLRHGIPLSQANTGMVATLHERYPQITLRTCTMPVNRNLLFRHRSEKLHRFLRQVSRPEGRLPRRRRRLREKSRAIRCCPSLAHPIERPSS